MHFRSTDRSFRELRFASVALALGGAAAAFALYAAQAAPSGLAYDQVTRMIQPGQPTAEPGNFSADYDGAVKNGKMPSAGHGLISIMMHASSMAHSALNFLKYGTPSRLYYWNGLERDENPAAQTATIYRPDRGQRIHLDLAAKTYTIDDLNPVDLSQTPPPYQSPQNPEAPPASPQPGTGKLDITVSSSALGQKTIETVPTTGYTSDFKIVSTESTGSCVDGTFETATTEYVSSYLEPQVAAPKGSTMHTMPKRAMPMGAMMAVKPGCTPKTTMHKSGGASAPADHLSLWSLVTVKASQQSQPTGPGGGFSFLTERGNLRTLGPADAAMFEIPADFTKAK